MILRLSKFDRHKKTSSYIYPHKHCAKCEKLIEESYTYCPECYKKHFGYSPKERVTSLKEAILMDVLK